MTSHKKTAYDRKDDYYHKAKAEGYRSRAAYKLIELDKAHNLLPRGAHVVELGAWPGGWLQVAGQKVGPNGLVCGIDLVEISEFPESWVKCIVGDATLDETIEQALGLSGRLYDTVLSDMSAKHTGIKEADRALAEGLAEGALYSATKLLRPGGNCVVKFFKSQEADQVIRAHQKLFNKIARKELDSTRTSSNEFYFVGIGLK